MGLLDTKTKRDPHTEAQNVVEMGFSMIENLNTIKY